MWRNTETRSCNHCYHGKAISITYSECVLAALIIQHAMRMRSIILPSVACPPLLYFSTLSHKQHDFRKKENYWTQKACLDFFYKFWQKYRVRINYRRISLRHNFRPDSVWFRQGQCLRPSTSKDTSIIATAHRHRNRERHTRHAWESLAGWQYRLDICRLTRGAHIEYI